MTAKLKATPKTRMVIDDRDAIRRALLIHKFQAKYDVLRARENLAAIAACFQGGYHGVRQRRRL
jgi:hypothetical protein